MNLPGDFYDDFDYRVIRVVSEKILRQAQYTTNGVKGAKAVMRVSMHHL